MLRLSVNRCGFTDKLFKINNLSVRRRVSTDKTHSVRQRLSGIAEVLTKKCGALRGMRQPQNLIESNNLRVVIWSILLSVRKIWWADKCRLWEKVGNLAFTAFLCWLKWNFGTREWFFAPARKQKAFQVRCLQWFYRTNEHIANTVKALVTYWGISYYMDLNLFLNMLTPIKKQGNEHIYILL